MLMCSGPDPVCSDGSMFGVVRNLFGPIGIFAGIAASPCFDLYTYTVHGLGPYGFLDSPVPCHGWVGSLGCRK